MKKSIEKTLERMGFSSIDELLEKLKDCEELQFPEIEELNFDDIDLNIDFDLDSIEFPEIDFDFSFLDEEEEQQ
jgi:hypothetical protein